MTHLSGETQQAPWRAKEPEVAWVHLEAQRNCPVVAKKTPGELEVKQGDNDICRENAMKTRRQTAWRHSDTSAMATGDVPSWQRCECLKVVYAVRCGELARRRSSSKKSEG